MATTTGQQTASPNKPSTQLPSKVHRILVVDPDRCTGCEICETVCSFAHDQAFNPINSRIHRVRIEPIINSTIACLSCYDPECIKACPLKALSKDKEQGIIHVDPALCDGCAACLRGCPFGVITVHTRLKKAITCDLCLSTPQKEPHCVDYCPKKAIFIKEIDPTVDENRFITLQRFLKAGFPPPPPGGMLN